MRNNARLSTLGSSGAGKNQGEISYKGLEAGIDKQVENLCKTCHDCQLVGLPTLPEPLWHTEFPSQPRIDLA